MGQEACSSSLWESLPGYRRTRAGAQPCEPARVYSYGYWSIMGDVLMGCTIAGGRWST